MNSKWHVWAMANNRHGKVVEYIQELGFVTDMLYPSVDKEYKTQKGNKTTKTVPLYANYIFVKYEHTIDNQAELNKCPWLTTYVGKCTKEEIRQIKEMNGKDYDDIIDYSGKLKRGNLVKLISSGFKDMIATVVSVDGDKIVVSVKLFGAERIMTCSVEDLVKLK